MTPKQDGFIMPAEWHPHERCWMAWPCHNATWKNIGIEKARRAFAKVAQAIAQYEPVTMLVPPDLMHKASRMCSNQIQLFEMPLNDSWTRDTGPTFLVNQQGELAGIDWIHNAWGGNYKNCTLDNQIAKIIIHETQAKYYHAPIVMEGGSFHVDGEGTILTTRECLLNKNRNPQLTQQQMETTLKNYLNTKKIIWLNKGLLGDQTNGHIDEIACFIAPGKVLVLITHDKEDENYAILQENLTLLKSATDAKGRTLEIYTIEQPPATYLNHQRLSLSYINFYLANQGIVMPTFGSPKQDQAAYALMASLFPNHHITSIEALDIFAGGGGIHCITQQQPKRHLFYKLA